MKLRDQEMSSEPASRSQRPACGPAWLWGVLVRCRVPVERSLKDRFLSLLRLDRYRLNDEAISDMLATQASFGLLNPERNSLRLSASLSLSLTRTQKSEAKLDSKIQKPFARRTEAETRESL